jgi:RimJ/RimL family protein N-acetyltransferase
MFSRVSEASVTLRKFKPADVPAVHRWFNNKAATRFLVVQRPSFSHAEAEDWVERALDEDGEDRKYAIVVSGREEPVGFTALYGLSRETGPELGALIGDDVRGKGVGRRAEALTIAKAFDEFGVDRIYGEIPVFNEAALRTVAGLGWQRQETLPDHGTRDGEPFDCEVWAVEPDAFRAAAGDLLS